MRLVIHMDTVNTKIPQLSEIGARLREEREILGLNQSAAGEIGGVKKNAQHNYETGKRAPSASYLAAIAEFGADIKYILTGKRHSQDSPNAIQLDNPPTNPVHSDLIYLPEYDIRASAGPGQTPATEHIIRDVGFKEQFLRDLGASPNQCSVIRASGDSMHPTIPDGSLLVIDHSQAGLHDGCIYVLGVADDLLVKRVRRSLDGSVDLISDNQQYYPVQSLGLDRLDELRVIGRVVYFCRMP